MKLAVFDIDGTLTVGDGLGTRCFFDSFDRTFGGVAVVDRRLESYTESTDCGITREAVLRALGRLPEERELASFKAAYFEMLEREIAARGQAYRANGGADLFLPRLAAHGDWAIAIATGNWRRAAELKLACAGIEAPPVAACSEDGGSRSQVLACAVATAIRRLEARIDAVVYVGDQPWDLHAARRIGAGFVGVGSGERAARLEGGGALVAGGFYDADAFVDLLEEAARRR